MVAKQVGDKHRLFNAHKILADAFAYIIGKPGEFRDQGS